MARRLGMLGPIIVIVGVAVACVGGWYAMHARPTAGAIIDTIPLGGDESFVIRDESGGERSYLELHKGSDVAWQALIPHYVGTHARPAIAWSPGAVTVRVQRSGRAEVFGLAIQNASKLGGFRLAPTHEPNTTQPEGPITLTDHIRSYELIGGDGWHQLVGVDLHTGEAIWMVELGKEPVTDGGIADGEVWIAQPGAVKGDKRYFDAFSGKEDRSRISLKN